MNSHRPLVQCDRQKLSAFDHLLEQPRLRVWSQSFAVGFLAAVGIASGWVPNLSERSPAQMFSTTAVAQSAAITDAEVKSYAEAVLTMEGVRQAAYGDIKKIIGSSNIPDIACHKQDSINKLPKNIRVIAVEYCKKSKDIVKSSGLGVDRFNLITVTVQKDNSLEKRIQNEMLRIQKASGGQ